MGHVKQLAGQTMVYGLGIVLPRLLNYALLTPFYTRIFSTSEYGIITELYAYLVFLMVLLTYGLETGLFRYADSERVKENVYKTTLISITVTTGIFLLFSSIFSTAIAGFIGYPGKESFILMMVWIIGLDAFSAIPFAKIRLENKAIRYTLIRLAEIFSNLLANWFFLYYCPRSAGNMVWIDSIYNPDYGVGYVLLSNLIGTIVKTALLFPEIIVHVGVFKIDIFRKLIVYSSPLLIAGLAGTVNEALDRVLLKHLLPASSDPLSQLGIYGANYKMAVLMTLFIQMFRYAAEPFFFSKKDRSDAKVIYASVMKYFIAAGIFIFLMVMLYIDVFKLFIGVEFRAGLGIVPIILLANLLMGIFYNQSIWYKLKNLTKYGAWLVLLGSAITVLINVLFIPVYGFVASAYAHLISYSAMVLLSYLLGRKFYDIPYDLKRIAIYFFLGLAVFLLFSWVDFASVHLEYLIKTLCVLFLISLFLHSEKIIILPKISRNGGKGYKPF